MKIYVSGSMYGGLEKIETYKKMIKALEKYGEVLNKQIADEQAIEKEAFQKDEEIFEDLEKKMYEADLLFAEVSIMALGVGYEIGFADKLGKKIIAIYDENYIPKVTTMIRGNKRIKLIPYKDIEEILENLKEILN